MIHHSPRLVAWLTAGLLMLPLAAGAQDTPPTPDTVLAPGHGWHVVRPGETLRSITQLYLGTDAAWQDNLRLNREQIRNPDLIFPGQRLQIVLPPALPAHSALLTRTARQVEDRLTPLPWNRAWNQDLLLPEDGVQTYDGASAELRFADDTHLVLTERSLVFLRGTPRVEQTPDRELIEVVVGQADLGRTASTSASMGNDIEIILGEAKAAPSAGDDGALRTRARVAETRGAQLMVYDGASTLEAAGQQVALPRGTGSSVAAGAPPSPPEPLLPAPENLEPSAGAPWARGGETPLRWQAVAGARSYTGEVCRDPRCGTLVARVEGLTGTDWRPADLPAATLYWRITAVAASGLDGYPSPATPVSVVDALPVADAEPPAVGARFTGDRVSVFGELILGPGATLVLEAEDQLSGVAGSRVLLDGAAVDQRAWSGPWAAGAHTAAAVVTDGAGNQAELAAIAFTYDPDPPVVRWRLVDDPAELGRAQGETPAAAVDAGPGSDWKRPPALSWSRGGAWRRLDRRAEVQAVGARLTIASRRPVTLDGAGVTLRRGQRLALEADDALSRAVNLSCELVERTPGRPVLVIRAIDLLGNATRLDWPLLPAPR